MLIWALVQALASIASLPQEKAAADKVSLLMSEILQLANRILPAQYAAHAQVNVVDHCDKPLSR